MKKNRIEKYRDKLLLVKVLSSLIDELKDLLKKKGREDLVHQLQGLIITSKCRCGDDFCCSIGVKYVGEEPINSAGTEENANLDLDPSNGYLILDIKGGKIVGLEILYRPEFKTVIDSLL